MKKLLEKPFIRKILYAFLGFILLFLFIDYIFMPWYVTSPETVVPNVVGLRQTQAMQKLENMNLEPMIGDTTYDEKYPRGTIVLQKPKAGAVVKEDRNIYLFISGGEPVVRVPQLKGKSIRDAKFALERLGLSLGNVEEIPSTNPQNMIFDQQFAEGTPLKKGENVGVSVSIGMGDEGTIEVPDLIGKSLTEAEIILADSSLRVGKINYQRSFSLLPNTILDQYPSKGNKINPGDPVDLFVTRAAEPTEEKEIIEEIR
ncbi:MAG: PASTA domain-containing protein [Ignavibacteriaceae bacterium]